MTDRALVAQVNAAIDRLTTAYFHGQVTKAELLRYGPVLGYDWWQAMGLPTAAELREHVRKSPP
jgi:hypothetical protein